MHYRSSKLILAVMFLLAACYPAPAEELLPTETAIPSATVTAVPVTQPPVPDPDATPDGTSQMEVIGASNWTRLQLLKTFPAETPFNNLVAAISPDGKTLAVGGRGGAQVLLFDIASGQLSQVVPINVPLVGNSFYWDAMEYLPDGTIVASSGGPYAIYRFDTAGNVLATWGGINFALSADKSILAHSSDTGVELVTIENNTPLLTLEDPDAMYFAFSPDGSKLAVEDIGVDYLNVAVWDIPNKTLLARLDETSYAHFSPDGKFLAVNKYDYENDTQPLKIFSPDGATELASLNVSEPYGLNNSVYLWSPDGSVIASQVAGGSPVAWDTTTWQLLEAPDLRGELHSFSPDGRILITRTEDGAILLWGVLKAMG